MLFFYASNTHMHTYVHTRAHAHTQREKRVVSKIGGNWELRELLKNLYVLNAI